MPSPIVHLHLLYHWCPEPSSELVLGAISPDAIHARPETGWQDKAFTHFYLEADQDFGLALKTARDVLKNADQDFAKGYLFHLLTDYYWRRDLYTPFFKARVLHMSRSSLHEAYYEACASLDQIILEGASWLEDAVKKLRGAGHPSFDLLSSQEMIAWRDRVLGRDLLEAGNPPPAPSFMGYELTMESFSAFQHRFLAKLGSYDL